MWINHNSLAFGTGDWLYVIDERVERVFCSSPVYKN